MHNGVIIVHKVFFSLQPMFRRQNDVPPPSDWTGGCSEGQNAFRFFHEIISSKRWASARHYTVDPVLLPSSGNPFKCHEEVLYLFAAYDPT